MKSIAEFPNYMVSESGTVITIKREREDKRVYQEKALLPSISKTGYATVCLYNNSGKKRIAIHRLVAIAFIPNSDNKPCVNHIDGDKLNNHFANLEWVDYSENGLHAYKTGLAAAWNKGNKSRSNRICPCGAIFPPHKITTRFCSKSCATKSRYHLLESGIITPFANNTETDKTQIA